MINLDTLPRNMRRHVGRDLDKINTRRRQLANLDERTRNNQLQQLRDTIAQQHGEEDLPGWYIEPLAFAAVSAQHNTGLEAHDEQIVTALVMIEGVIAEMATGEGKTLATGITAIAYALAGHHTHIMTANEYLATRDAATTAKVAQPLGITVAATTEDADNSDRAAVYSADIVYGTASQFGFDYLNDNLVSGAAHIAQRGHDVIIVDEADALLLDDARTPLIISHPSGVNAETVNKIEAAARWAETLGPAHVNVDHTTKSVSLTEQGAQGAEIAFGVNELFDHPALAAMCLNAATARFAYDNNTDYLINGDPAAVIIIDQATGRPAPDRRWSNGLHEAVEAKENTEIHAAAPAIATITVPSYLSKYRHITATTGTALSAKDEFVALYGLNVVRIPTHRPIVRDDQADIMFITRNEKLQRVVADITEVHRDGRPVLVGTPSVADADWVSTALTAAGIDHSVLSARNPAAEALIVAQAGAPGAVTVATNMAGRGVDIRLGGDPAPALADPDANHSEIVARYDQQRADVIAAGGLAVLSTARHDARRIDDQLLGRAGRQGEPGSSRFYVSLQDNLLEHYGSKTAIAAITRATKSSHGALSHKRVSALVESAQEAVQEKHREARQKLIDTQAVIDAQREQMYEYRHTMLTAPWRETLNGMFEKAYSVVLLDPAAFIDLIRSTGALDGVDFEVINLVPPLVAGLMFTSPQELSPELAKQLNDLMVATSKNTDFEGVPVEQLAKQLADAAFNDFVARHSADVVADDVVAGVVAMFTMSNLDQAWSGHLADLEALAQGVMLRAVAQEDWRLGWVQASYELYAQMLDDYAVLTARQLLAMTVTLPERTGLAETPELEPAS